MLLTIARQHLSSVSKELKAQSLSCQDRTNDGLNNGTCGYGQLRNQWPLVGEVAFSAANPAVQGLPMNACGSCWEIQCASSAAGKVTMV